MRRPSDAVQPNAVPLLLPRSLLQKPFIQVATQRPCHDEIIMLYCQLNGQFINKDIIIIIIIINVVFIIMIKVTFCC